MQQPAIASKPRFRDDGTVEVPAFELLPSVLSSPEAQAMRALMPGGAPPSDRLDVVL